MDLLDAIFTRRSVRRFSSKKVSAANIEVILKAAMSAPSAHNEQPWQFLVITERELLDQISKVHPYAKMCLEAPLAIIPCVDLSLHDYSDAFWVQDLSAAAQNILLTARALDLGAVWLGVYPNKKIVSAIAQMFELPKDVIPLNIIPIGHTDVVQSKTNPCSAGKVHNNKW
jgi:nitroreductase